jgi:nucleotide-binding universal stress UspA family protein
MNNSILVPLDFSEYSLRAFQVALEFAKKMNLGIIVLNVYDSPISSGVNFIAYEKTLAVEEKKSMSGLAKFIADNQEHTYEDGSALVIKALSYKGDPGASIIKIAEEEDVAMIVMGTKGEKGLIAKMLGSVTEEVLESAHCPVLIVPRDVEFDGIRKMLFAAPLDANDDKLINILLSFADTFNAHLECLHISSGFEDYEEDKANMRALEEQFALISPKRLSFKQVIKNASLDLAEELQFEIDHDRVDMLITLPKPRGFLGELFKASLTKKMAKLADVPILALKG